MIQDRAQKAQVLRYIVAKRWFPQLEVNVLPRIATASTQKPLTDIDVLALIPDEFDGFRIMLVDCKTKKGESPITRALWQRGLMDQIGATRGICIFKKNKIEPDHRYTAAQFGVLLLTEEDFERYVGATGARTDSLVGNVANIDLWQKFYEIPFNNTSIGSAVQFSSIGYWMSRTDSDACRKTLAQISRINQELDPVKPTHMAVVADLIALFMHSISKIVSKVFASYLQPDHRIELSEALLTLIYGGREAYDYLNSLQRQVRKTQSQNQVSQELRLPDWDNFLQLIRHCLDAPIEVSKSPLLIREVAWTYLCGDKKFDFARMLASDSPQAAKLALLGSEYLCRAARLPPEFGANLSEMLLSLQLPPS